MSVIIGTSQEQESKSAQNPPASPSLPLQIPEGPSKSGGPELLPSSRNLRVAITDRDTGQILANQSAELSVVPVDINQGSGTAAYRLLVRDPGSSNISESLVIVDYRSVTLIDPNGKRTELGQLPRLPRGGADGLGERLKLFFENEVGGQSVVGSTLMASVPKLRDIDPAKCDFSVAVTKVPEVYSGSAWAQTFSIERYQQEERYKLVSKFLDKLPYQAKEALFAATKSWVAGEGPCPVIGTNTLESLGINREEAKATLQYTASLPLLGGLTIDISELELPTSSPNQFISRLSTSLSFIPGPAPTRYQHVGVHFVVRDGKEFDVIIGTLPSEITLRPPYKVGITISEDSGVKLTSETPGASITLSSNGIYNRSFAALDHDHLEDVIVSDLPVTSPDLHRTVFHFSYDGEAQKLYLIEPSRDGDRILSRLITGLSPEEKNALQGGPSSELNNALNKILNSLLTKTSIVQRNLPAPQSQPTDFPVAFATISFTTVQKKAPL